MFQNSITKATLYFFVWIILLCQSMSLTKVSVQAVLTNTKLMCLIRTNPVWTTKTSIVSALISGSGTKNHLPNAEVEFSTGVRWSSIFKITLPRLLISIGIICKMIPLWIAGFTKSNASVFKDYHRDITVWSWLLLKIFIAIIPATFIKWKNTVKGHLQEFLEALYCWHILSKISTPNLVSL